MSRRRRSSASRNTMGRAVLGLILIAMGISTLFSSDNVIGFLMLIGGLMLLGAIMNSAQRSQFGSQLQDVFSDIDFSLTGTNKPFQRGGSSTRTASASRPTSAKRTDKMHRVAAKAVKKAGQNPREMVVAPVDIGVLVYEDRDATPTLYRETRLPDEAGFIRPFMLLRSPRRARGNIRFELLDGAGVQRFVNETEWELKAGETFVYPDTWLPMQDIDDLSGDWMMRVYAADVLLAAHEFAWRDLGGGDFRQYLTGDGEISEDLLDDLSGSRVERLSLDDLLDEQAGTIVEYDPEAEEAARRNQRMDRHYNRRR